MKHKLEIVEGVGGLAVYLNDIRITPRSTKPLGGGVTKARWAIPAEVLDDATGKQSSER